jgi:hypothetical protein
VLSWLPPEHFNGILGNYKIFVNKRDPIIIEAFNITGDERIRRNLTGLEPYRYYDVSVNACTTECSNSTQTSFTTAMGNPGQIEKQPLSTFQQENYKGIGIIQWGEPSYKGGEMDFYEILITEYDKSKPKQVKQIRQIRSFIKSKECIWGNMCHNDTNTALEFSVRGVNFFLSPHQSKDSPGFQKIHEMIKGSEETPAYCDAGDPILKNALERVKKFDKHSQYFYGPWSPPNQYPCGTQNHREDSNIVIIMFLMIASIGIVVLIFMLYQKIRDIKNIIVEFPPGLEELSVDKAVKKNKHNTMEVPDLLHNVDNNSLANEDEHKRLLRGSMNGSINGGDCSSSVSDNTRSVTDQHDDIEYQQDFESAKQYDMHDDDNVGDKLKVSELNIFPWQPKKFFCYPGNFSLISCSFLQSFLWNPSTGEALTPILVPHEPMPSPRESPKPNITVNPTDSTGSSPPSSGYVSAPSPSNVQLNGNNYVTPTIFSVSVINKFKLSKLYL